MLNCKCLSTSRTGLYILNNAWHDVRAQCINISTSQATIDWICARLNYDSVNLIYNIKLLNVIYRKIPLDLLPTSPKYLYSDKIIPTVPKSHCFEKWRWIHFLWWRWCGSRPSWVERMRRTGCRVACMYANPNSLPQSAQLRTLRLCKNQFRGVY